MYFSNQDSEAGSVPYTHFTVYTNKHCTLISDCSRFWSSCCTPYFAATTEAQLCWRLTTFTLSTNPYFCGSAWRTAGWKRQRQMSNEVFDTHRLCVYSIDKRSKQIQIEEICSTLHSRRLRTDLQRNCPKPPLHQDSWSRDHAGNAHSVFPCPLLNTEVQWVNNTECSSLLWAFPPVSRVSWSWIQCFLAIAYLAEKADVEAKGLCVSGARVHVVAEEQHQLQELAEALTLLELLAGQGHCHDIRFDVVHMLLEHEPEQDPVEPCPQHLHRAHLHNTTFTSKCKNPEVYLWKKLIF